jgi:hypothetical protein
LDNAYCYYFWVRSRSATGITGDWSSVQTGTPDRAGLGNITPSPGTLSPAFSETIYDYTLIVEPDITSLELTAAIANGTGGTITSSTNPVTITNFSSPFTFTVTGKHNDTATKTKDYTVNFIKKGSGTITVDLSALTITDKAETIDISASPLSWKDNTELELTADLSGLDVTDYQWMLDNSPLTQEISGSPTNLTKHARDFSVAAHVITLRVKIDGLWYSKSVEFKVEL